MGVTVVLVDNREKADCALQKSTTARLRRYLEQACERHGAVLRIVRSRTDVAALLEEPVAAIVLGGSSISLSTRVQLESIAHATAMVSRFPSAAVMGVCFGHQVLAALFGGAVGPLDQRRQGWMRVTSPKDSRQRYCNHADHVTELPPGFRQTHTDERGLVMGMESFIGHRVLRGFQYHPEADPDLPLEVEEFVRGVVSPRARL